MKRTRIRCLAITIAIGATLATGCTQTVTRTRVVPVYSTQSVSEGARVAALGNAAGASRVTRTRLIQVGTRTETYKVERIDWKRTGATLFMGPVLFISYLIASLG